MARILGLAEPVGNSGSAGIAGGTVASAAGAGLDDDAFFLAGAFFFDVLTAIVFVLCGEMDDSKNGGAPLMQKRDAAGRVATTRRKWTLSTTD